jgi:hypothetical protein
MKSARILLAVLALLMPGAALAQPAGETHLSLAYDGRLILKVLDIHLEERIAPGAFSASAQLNSFGVLALFKKFDVHATTQGRIEEGQARPGVFHYDNNDGKRNRHVVARWGDDEVAVSSVPPYGDLGQPPASRAQKLASTDPLTQLMRLTLASAQSNPCGGGVRDFFDGKQLYALEFGAGAPGALSEAEQHLGLNNPVRCAVHFREVAGFKAKPPEQRNMGLKRAIAVTFGQIAADGPWVIASIQTETPLGMAYINLSHIHVTNDRSGS